MMLALGVGAYGAAIFHLFTHAFFKALLFLGAGSVNHASGTFDMRYMGGLRKVMPWTYLTFLIAGLSLAGIFPLAGFWSKDEIMAHASGGDGVAQLVFWLGIAAAFMTAFYIFRAVFMTFAGEFRGGAKADPEPPPGGEMHMAESPRAMVWPLVVLAVMAVLAGFVNSPVDLGVVPAHWLSDFLSDGPVHLDAESFDWPVAILSTGVAVTGIVLAYLMYGSRRISAERMAEALRPAHVLLTRKYYFDEAYERYLVGFAFYDGVAGFLDWTDKTIVDGFVRLVGRVGRNVGGFVAQFQTGQLQGYGFAISVGVLGIFGVYILFR
jgi:NADH-quinone oxidoreductase subunit L